MLTQEANDRYTRVGPGHADGRVDAPLLAPGGRGLPDERQVDDEGPPPRRGPDPLQGPLGRVRAHRAALCPSADEPDLRDTGGAGDSVSVPRLAVRRDGSVHRAAVRGDGGPGGAVQGQDPDAGLSGGVEGGAAVCLPGPAAGPPSCPTTTSSPPPACSGTFGYAELPCNWLQCQENSLDPVAPRVAARRLGELHPRDERRRGAAHPSGPQDHPVRRVRARHHQAPHLGGRLGGGHRVEGRSPHRLPQLSAAGRATATSSNEGTYRGTFAMGPRVPDTGPRSTTTPPRTGGSPATP